MSRIKYLKPEEVKPEYREYCDFSTQELRAVKAGRRRLFIRVQCPRCTAWRWVVAYQIRYDGCVHACHSCSRAEVKCQLRKPLQPNELPAEDRQYCDFAHQEMRTANSGGWHLFIRTECPRCGTERWRTAAGVRYDGRVRHCVSCANLRPRTPLKRVDRDGYIAVKIRALSGLDRDLARKMTPKHEIAEHRLIIARHLGRPLHSDAHVHHRNSDRADNRLANLRLVTQKTHHLAPADDIAKLSVEIEHLARTAEADGIDLKPLLRRFIKELSDSV